MRFFHCHFLYLSFHYLTNLQLSFYFIVFTAKYLPLPITNNFQKHLYQLGLDLVSDKTLEITVA